MDDFVSIAVVVLLVVLVLWLLVWRASSRRRRERAEDREQWRELISRTYALEQSVRELQTRRPTPAAESTPKSSESPVGSSAPPFPTPDVVSSSPTPPVDITSPAVRLAEAWVSRETTEPATRDSYAQDSATADRDPLAPTPAAPIPPPSFAATESAPSLAGRLKTSLDVEEMLGTNWLNKLGIVILVLGIAFFLAYQLKTLGPAGKVLVGFATAAVMLGAGIWFDRKERYRILARAGIGGGWALAFFTTYAMYRVPAAQVLSSQPLDLVLMLVIAATMVLHTL